MTELEQLKQKVTRLEGIINGLVLSDRFAFHKNIQLADGRAMQLGTTLGTRFGTAANQKLSFFGGTPVVQHASATANTCNTGGLNTPLAEDATWKPSTTAYHIGDLMKAAVDYGLLAP
jgi:hypothetical protein